MRQLPALLIAAALAGCAAAPALDQTPDQTPDPALDATSQAWTTGRMSLRIEARGEQAAHSVASAFELRGGGDHGELNLLSPLGTRLAAARWSPGAALLQTSQGEQAFASLEQLSLQALGEKLPLQALPDWLAGRPWRGAPSSSTAAGIEQLGWALDFSRRALGQIEARRAAPPTVLLRLRLDPPQP